MLEVFSLHAFHYRNKLTSLLSHAILYKFHSIHFSSVNELINYPSDANTAENPNQLTFQQSQDCFFHG